MTLAAGIVFGISLFAIIFLFVFKRYEVARAAEGRAAWRDEADEFALHVKWFLMVVEWYLAHTPQFLTLFGRWLVHAGALAFARLARVSEAQAHRLADVVSHKHNFKRTETKSTFLKEVSEYKNGSSDDSVATK